MTDALRVRPADLAALSFRAKDAINREVAFLEGKELAEGEVLTIAVRTVVTRNDAGALIFGPLAGKVKTACPS